MNKSRPALYLVTGGAGFIGSNLVEALLSRGERVRVIDDFSTGRLENLAPFLDRIELIEASITDEDTVERALQGVDYVLHQAALPSVARSLEEPARTNLVNVQGTVILLEAAIRARNEGLAPIKRFVIAGSSSVYGNTTRLPKRESDTPSPLSPYAVSKLAQEHYGQIFHRVYDLPVIILRYFNIYGPRQDPLSQYAAVVPAFITALLRGDRPVIYGDGEQTRDFTYVADCVQANLRACTAPSEACGKIFNVSFGKRISINELLSTICELMGKEPVEPLYQPARPGDVRDSLADTSLARQYLGYHPNFPLEKGLMETIRWFQQAQPTAKVLEQGMEQA